MKRILHPCSSVALACITLASTGHANTPVLVYNSSGSCIGSPEGIDTRLQPVNWGVAWRITFNAVGSADGNGNITETGQSVDSASFGVGPRMHVPAASAYSGTFTSALSGPNEDGSFTLHAGTMSGGFTAGPLAGLTFTVSGFELKGWKGDGGISLYGSSGTPMIQTFSLSNGMKFQRICTLWMMSMSPRQ